MYFCIICEALKFNEGLFCGYCDQKIKSKSPKVHLRFEQNIPHFYLFRWNEESHAFCHSLVYFLKNKDENYFNYFSSIFKEADLNISSFDTMICPTNSKPQKPNHSLSLGKSLAKQIGGKIVIELEVNDKEQKKLSKKERNKAQKKLSFPRVKKWIFIDDILVSGATFGKVLTASPYKPKFILTLAYKPANE